MSLLVGLSLSGLILLNLELMLGVHMSQYFRTQMSPLAADPLHNYTSKLESPKCSWSSTWLGGLSEVMEGYVT